MKRFYHKSAGVFSGILVLSLLSGCSSSKSADSVHVKLDPSNPTVITAWHYYNGGQQQILNDLITEFNDSVGAKKGIIVDPYSKGSVNDLSDAVLASANKEIGAEPMPDLFAAYSDCAAVVNQLGLVADLSQYMTEDEINSYMDSYIHEGEFDGTGSLKLFPVAKSTEILLINETEWNQFSAETGADKSEFSTWEGIVDLAHKFYDWTDAKTPDIPNDGKSFFGRDAFANYMLIGSKQLGAELFQVENGTVHLQFDKNVMHRLWDCYYVPFVNGWFGAYGKFRSDDIKTGQLFALVGSTSGATYFPSEVTLDDGSTTPIECGVYPLPNFKDTEPYAVQQGAGFVVTKSSPEKEYAASVFLKWITESEQNIRLSVNSGYLPVKKEANDPELLASSLKEANGTPLQIKIVETAAQVTSTYHLYTPNAFANGDVARKIVESHMSGAAADARNRRDELIASGMSWDEAVASLTSEEAFETWLKDFTSQLEAAVQ